MEGSMNFPNKCAVTGLANKHVLELIQAQTEDGNPVMNYAEIGVYQGDTTIEVARMLELDATIQLFDFEHRIKDVEDRLKADPILAKKDIFIRLTPNTDLTYDSYNWSLAHCLMEQLSYDFVFIDGAHTFHHDGMAFMLIDKMLRPGGIIVFDDQEWTMATSKTMNPEVYPEITQQYTEDQICALQVKMIIELLVKPDPRYEELIPDKAYRKVVPVVDRPSDNSETRADS
jgi:predicted O-methyltransferase YrrM